MSATTRFTTLINDAPKPAFAALGAADIAVSAAAKRAEALPGEAAAGLAKARQVRKGLLDQVQEERAARIAELRTRLESGLESAKKLRNVDVEATVGTVRGSADGYLSLMRNVLDSLSARGEAKATELRDTLTAKVAPAVGTVSTRIGSLGVDTKETADAVRSAAAHRTTVAKTRLRGAAPKKTTVRTTPAKTTASKASAPKATARKTSAATPAAKAPAKKATARKTPAKRSTSSS